MQDVLFRLQAPKVFMADKVGGSAGSERVLAEVPLQALAWMYRLHVATGREKFSATALMHLLGRSRSTVDDATAQLKRAGLVSQLSRKAVYLPERAGLELIEDWSARLLHEFAVNRSWRQRSAEVGNSGLQTLVRGDG